MEKDKLEIQVLLEIALNQKIQGNIETGLPPVLNLYMRKLNCFGVAVYQSHQWIHFLPHALKSNTEWLDRLDFFSGFLENENSQQPICQKIGDNYLYGYPLKQFGWIVLIRKKSLSDEMVFELSKVVNQLGRDICQINEEKRLKLLQLLFDQSSDAIQISDETGKLYYINKVASERLGIETSKVSEHYVSDFELIFKDQSKWKEHIEHLKKKGQMVIEGLNKNQKTNHEIPVEVTVNLVEVNSTTFVVANSRDISVRKKEELKLKDTTQKLTSIFNEMSDVVWSVNLPDYKMIFVTPSVETLYEISVDAWMNDSQLWQKMIHPKDSHVIIDIFKKLKKHGYFSVEYRILTPSGKEKWIKNKGKIIYDDQGREMRLDGVIIDLTQQFLAQEALDQELRLQEALIDIASTYINLDHRDVDNTINSSLKKMGLFVSSDRAYIFNYDFLNQTTSNTYEWCNDGVSPEINNLQDVPLEYFPQWVEKHKRGEAFYIPDVLALDQSEEGLKSVLEPQGIKSLIAIPIIDGDELVGFVGFDSVKNHYQYSEKEQKLLFLFGQMLINIRNRQKWETQLSVQEEKYRNIITNMNLGLIEVNLNDEIQYANQSFCEMSGYDLEELKGRRAAELFLSYENQQLIKDKAQKRKHGITDSYEIEVNNKKGDKKHWFVSGAPNFNDKGQQIGSIGVHLDITSQKMLENDLANAKNFAEAAAKAKELFLANMSHEIRTPLNVIIGMIRQLYKEDLNSEQQFYVKQSDSSAKHLLTILNNVLDMAKIESGDMEIIKNAFSPSALAYNVHSILYSQAKEKNLNFKLNVSPNIKPVLEGDETRLRQVLLNLLGNAIKFTDLGNISLSVVLLKENERSQQLRFEVSDTGIGMSKEFITKIFDKFSQENDMYNRKYEGTGLGMAISKDLINLMGGDLFVESKKNEGTVFYFDLEFEIGDPQLLVSKSTQVKANSFKGKKVLLVEDNEMNRFIAIQSLQFLGFETVEAENGKMAIEKIKQESFDLILMDIQMPVMDGVECTGIIREQLLIKTPIIALTANAFKHDIDLYLSKGMSDFITKPYDEQEFFRKIDHVLGLDASLKLSSSPILDKNTQNIREQKMPLYDLEQIEKMSRGNESFIKKMIEIFISLSRENTQILQKALIENDILTINRIAHKLKPSIDQMGITSMKEIVRKLEKFETDFDNQNELESLVNNLNSTLTLVANDLEERN